MRNVPRQQKGIPMKMVEQEERLASFSGLVASLLPVGGKLSAIAALLLLTSCGTSSEQRASVKNDQSAAFLKIGSRSITEAVRAESFVLSRCIFLDQGHLTHISLQAQLTQAPEAARAELGTLLGGLQGRRTKNPGKEPAPSSPVRIYQLQPSSDWIVDLSVEEFSDKKGKVRVVCNLRNKGEQEFSISSPAPQLLKYIRANAARKLLEQMNRPRIPIDQHFQALAGFLGTDALSADQQKRARRLLITKAGKSGRNQALVSTLLDHVSSFDERDLAALNSDGSIAPRVFYLAWSASRGLEKPLGELLVLSLEYHGDALLFQRALTALFPAVLNSRLYALHPPGRDREGALAFIRKLRETITKAEYRDGRGWVLEP